MQKKKLFLFFSIQDSFFQYRYHPNLLFGTAVVSSSSSFFFTPKLFLIFPTLSKALSFLAPLARLAAWVGWLERRKKERKKTWDFEIHPKNLKSYLCWKHFSSSSSFYASPCKSVRRTLRGSAMTFTDYIPMNRSHNHTQMQAGKSGRGGEEKLKKLAPPPELERKSWGG